MALLALPSRLALICVSACARPGAEQQGRLPEKGVPETSQGTDKIYRANGRTAKKPTVLVSACFVLKA